MKIAIELDGILICIFSLFFVIDGISMLRGKKILPLPYKIGYIISKFIHTNEEVERLKAKHVGPEELRRTGWISVIVGSIAFVMGLLLFIEDIKPVLWPS